MNEFDTSIFFDEEALRPGDSFDKYIVVSEIARGGMGVVYKCQEKELQRFVAVKFLLKEAKNIIAEKRFLREAKIMGRLQHPNITDVYNVGNYNGHVYIVMEFLEGQALDSFRTQDFSLQERLALIKKVALALHYAHQNGIIHRDIKPSNIFIEKDNNPKIMDFGLAKNLKVDKQLTQIGEVLGTPRYMSPEQINGSYVSAQTDIYSLGSILFEVVSGEKMIEGEHALQIFYNIRLQKTRCLIDIMDVSKTLNAVCCKATSKQHQRYKTMIAFANDLDALLKNRKRYYYKKSLFTIFIVFVIASFACLYLPKKTTKNPDTIINEAMFRELEDYIRSIKNSLLNRQYLAAKRLLQEVRKKFPQQQQGQQEQLRYLRARTLLGLKEYDTFNQKCTIEELRSDLLCLISIAEMYYYQQQPQKVKQTLEVIENPTDEKYVGQVSVRDVYNFLSGYVSFATNQRNSYLYFKKIPKSNHAKFAKEYPMFDYYLGIFFQERGNLRKSFIYLEKAYEKENRYLILDAMINCVMESFHYKTSRFWGRVYARFSNTLKSINKHSTFTPRIHHCLARIHDKINENRKDLALYHIAQAIELGENKTEAFNFLAKMSNECLLNNDAFPQIVENSFFEYTRNPEFDIFANKVFSLHKKYERDYLHYYQAIDNRQKNLGLLKKARDLETKKVIIRSLPADQETIEYICKSYPSLVAEELLQFYNQKIMNLQRYRLAYLYSQSDSQMYSRVEEDIDKLFREIFCNREEDPVMRFATLTVLLRVYDYSQFKKQQIPDQKGRIIFDLLLYRNSLIDLDKITIDRIWKWSNTSQVRGAEFIKTLLLSILIYKSNYSIVSSMPKNYLQKNVIQASYVYHHRKNKKAERFLISMVKNHDDLERRIYAYSVMMKSINAKNIHNKKNINLLFLGLRQNSLAKMAIRTMINCGRSFQGESIVADKRFIGGIFHRTVKGKSLREYLEDFFLSKDWELVKLSVRLWANLRYVNYPELQKIINDSRIPSAVRATCYFHFIKNNPQALLISFISHMQKITKELPNSKYEIFASAIEVMKKEYNLEQVVSVIQDESLKLMIHRLMRKNMYTESFLDELNNKKQQRKYFAAIYINAPINESLDDFPIKYFCNNARSTLLQSFINEICRQSDIVNRLEVKYRRNLRRSIFRKMKDLYTPSLAISERQIFWMSRILYTDSRQHKRFSDEWMGRREITKQLLASGFYQSLRSIFFDFKRLENLKQLIDRKHELYFPLLGSNVIQDTYSLYIEFLKKSIHNKDLKPRLIEKLNYAILFDGDHPTYLYERAIIYREMREYDQALKLLTKALSIEPHNTRYKLEKIEIELLLKKAIDFNTLSIMCSRTNNRIFLKRIAKIYEHRFPKKAQKIYRRLYMEDLFDKDCLQKIIATYREGDSDKKSWQKILSDLEEKIEKEQLPIK
ncbi:protein kinase [Candidatus Uabimicrobium sp. HlEnr_7]|uniref:serine/threonine protein kinase n=1 Tax=Candidatus Uabimicrobium helgolandensis TaxID=3095367 RepID=UPI003557EDBD